GDTVHRPQAAPAPEAGGPAAERSKRKLLIVASAVLALVGAVLVFFATRGGDGSATQSSSDVIEVNDGVGASLVAEPPEQVAPFVGVANADGTFTFTWAAVSQAGASYAVTDEGGASASRIDAPSYTGSTSCISVATISESGLISAPVRGCVE
ncbi:MAG: hypothetical protein WCC60_00525, partial [Ilumatobacteraceae bacterium]